MNLEQRNVMIFRNERDGRVSYSVGLSRKNQDGGYENSYFPIKFKKGIDLANKTRIKLLNSYLTFDNYTDKDGKNRTFNYIMVIDFESEAKIEENSRKDVDRAFEELGKELSEEEFPW